ncbi:hypothetical protein ACFVZN_22940 [Streptomyces virginiae]|uniref:hypothetical protein n=1 Tax=Streptomyces virginiae TaxID=1961 RepID=UPI00369E933B
MVMTNDLAMTLSTIVPALAIALALEVRHLYRWLRSKPHARAHFRRFFNCFGICVYVYALGLLFLEWRLLAWMGAIEPRPVMPARGMIILVLAGMAGATLVPAMALLELLSPVQTAESAEGRAQRGEE